jgi:tRNA threonylcarbamoyladenosine biosynthesis protein TsaB
MSLTLAIATATSQVGVALGDGEDILAALHLRQGRRHAETLAPAIEALTRLTNTGLDGVDLIAVDVGPGLFTGLRVGVATAKALASALGLPLVACSSLDVLAHPHRRDGRLVASVVDARRGEVFWALFRPEAGRMVAATHSAVCDPATLVDALASWALAPGGGPVLVTGDGARRYAGDLAALTIEGVVEIAAAEFDHPSPTALVAVSATCPALAPEAVEPMYLRGADVRIGWEQRDG